MLYMYVTSSPYCNIYCSGRFIAFQVVLRPLCTRLVFTGHMPLPMIVIGAQEIFKRVFQICSAPDSVYQEYSK